MRLRRFVKRSNEGRGPAGLAEVRQSYEFSLDTVGQDISAGGLWQVSRKSNSMDRHRAGTGGEGAKMGQRERPDGGPPWPHSSQEVTEDTHMVLTHAPPLSAPQEYIQFLQSPKPGTEPFTALFPGSLEGQEEAARTPVVRCATQQPFERVFWRGRGGWQLRVGGEGDHSLVLASRCSGGTGGSRPALTVKLVFLAR